MQIHYSLKNEILIKVFYSKYGLWRRTCCCCRCLHIWKEEKKKKKIREKGSTWVKPWFTRREILWVLQHSTTYNTLQHFKTSHKHLSSLQMQIKLSVSSCFLFMVSIFLFLYQLYFYLVKQEFLKNVYFSFWTRPYRKYMIHLFEANLFQQSLFKFKGKSIH